MTNLDVFVTRPYIFFVVANRGGFGFEVVCRGNSQNQGVNTVATVDGGAQTVVDGVSASGTLTDLDVFVTIPNIFFVVANRGGFGLEVIGRGDGQNQGVNTVTSVYRGAQTVVDGIGVSGALTNLDVLVTFPNILFIVANRGGFGLEVIGWGDGQNQGVNTVAAIDGGAQTVVDGVSVSNTLTNLDVFVTFPNILFVVANRCGLGLEVVSRGDVQRELVNAVAAIDGLQAVPNGVSAFGQNADFHFVTFPYIFFIVANRGGFRNEIGRIDGQYQRIDTVASVASMVVGRMCAALANGFSLPYNR